MTFAERIALLVVVLVTGMALGRGESSSTGRQQTTEFRLDLTRYFPTAEDEARSRAVVVREAETFAASATPTAPQAVRRWVGEYEALLEAIERHDIYVYVRAEEDDEDAASAKADEDLGVLESRVTSRLVRAAQELGSEKIESLLQDPSLVSYKYLFSNARDRSKHLEKTSGNPVESTTVVGSASSRYKDLQKLGPIGAHAEAYAALLLSTATARNAIARQRGFDTADEASYFDKSLSKAGVDRALAAARASTSYARYLVVAARARQTAFAPPTMSIADAIATILASEQPMGTPYASAFAALLDPASHRLDLCTAPHCDHTGFSVGFAGAPSGVYYGSYTGQVATVRALAHEAGHAVHRDLMSRNQPIASYNQGPHFMFESFAIFNELLLLDHLYATAPNDEQRGYFLNQFLDDATFQVFGSAEETDLESAIYHGVDGGTVKTAENLGTLATEVASRYDPTSAQTPGAALSWARNRLFFTDPFYDVNYLYAGLLAEKYFVEFQRHPAAFAQQYMALLENGFDDSPAVLEKRFLGIDLTDEVALVANANSLIDARTGVLSRLAGGMSARLP